MGVIAIIQCSIEGEEGAADVADDDYQDEQSVEDVVEEVEGRPYNVGQEAIMEQDYFVDLEQIDQLDDPCEGTLPMVAELEDGNRKADQIIYQLCIQDGEPLQFHHIPLKKNFF